MSTATQTGRGNAGASRASKARQVPVTPAVRALSQLPRVDYADAFVLETPDLRARTAEEWSRAILEGASTGAGRALWRVVSEIGLLPRADTGGGRQPVRTVQAWAVRRSTRDMVLLAASARIGIAAELLFKRQDGALLWATLVHLRNPVARVAWTGLTPVHRLVVPFLLDHVDPPPAAATNSR